MKPPSEKKSEEPMLPAPSYPSLESFIETATESEVEALYQPILEALNGLKGPQVDKAKKIDAAIVKSSELLGILLGVRARLEEESTKSHVRR